MASSEPPLSDAGAAAGLQARRVAGRYRLLEVIGTGGMGAVWRAYDELLSREVAVKELRVPAGTESAEGVALAERTLREARAAGRLANPHVVTVYNVVLADGRPWIVMELLRARSLAAVIDSDGRLGPDRVARIGLQVLSALQDAHRHGMLHRDVKPGNVMLSPGDWVTLTDFGLVTSAGDTRLTAVGVVLGSPSYVAPERARRGGEPGPASDLFSLGATLYAAVEGQPPFRRDTALDTVAAVLHDKPAPMRHAGPLKDVISALLRKDPRSRPDAESTRRMLERAAATRARAPSPIPAPADPLPDGDVTAEVPEQANPAESTTPIPAPAPTPAPAPAPVPAPRHAEAAATPGQPGDKPKPGARRWLLLALVALAVAVVAIVGGYLATRSSDDAARLPGVPAAAQPRPEAPQAYEIYTHPIGYTLAVPVGWTRSGPEERAEFTDPTGSAVLRVTTDPEASQAADGTGGALAALQEAHAQEAASSADYALITLEQVEYRGWDAADWERTEGTGGIDAGARHALTRAFLAPSAGAATPTPYAITLETPEDSWPQLESVFTAAVETFQPPRD